MRNLLVAASVIAILSVASGANAQEKLKFAVFTPEAEMTHQVVMKPWAERVNKDSNGTLDIQTFPNGALGRNPGLQTKMLQDGVADIAWVIPSYTPGVYLDDDVFELPNIIQDSVEGSLAAWHLLQQGKLRGYDQYYMSGCSPPRPIRSTPTSRCGKPRISRARRSAPSAPSRPNPSRRWGCSRGHAVPATSRSDLAWRHRRHHRTPDCRLRFWRVARHQQPFPRPDRDSDARDLHEQSEVR